MFIDRKNNLTCLLFCMKTAFLENLLRKCIFFFFAECVCASLSNLNWYGRQLNSVCLKSQSLPLSVRKDQIHHFVSRDPLASAWLWNKRLFPYERESVGHTFCQVFTPIWKAERTGEVPASAATSWGGWGQTGLCSGGACEVVEVLQCSWVQACVILLVGGVSSWTHLAVPSGAKGTVIAKRGNISTWLVLVRLRGHFYNQPWAT